jgi:hypothetical protein
MQSSNESKNVEAAAQVVIHIKLEIQRKKRKTMQKKCLNNHQVKDL